MVYTSPATTLQDLVSDHPNITTGAAVGVATGATMRYTSNCNIDLCLGDVMKFKYVNSTEFELKLPALPDANHLLQLGEKILNQIIAWCGNAVVQAWAAVKGFIVTNFHTVWGVICSHPYVATVGLVCVAAAVIYYLIRRWMKKTEQEQQPKAIGDAPKELVCPLSKQMMADPVITASGHTYDRPAIEKYLAEHGGVDPNGQPTAKLTPNLALRKTINQWKQG